MNKYLVVALFLLAAAAQSQTLVAVEAFPLKAGSPAVIRFIAKSDTILSEKASFCVVMPKGFDISNLIFADSNSLTGGFLVSVKNDTVIVKRSGVGNTIQDNLVFDWAIAVVTLPENVSEQYDFSVRFNNNLRINNQLFRSALQSKTNQ